MVSRPLGTTEIGRGLPGIQMPGWFHLSFWDRERRRDGSRLARGPRYLRHFPFAGDERHHEENEENDKADFGDCRCYSGQASKAKQRRNECDNQENDCVV